MRAIAEVSTAVTQGDLTRRSPSRPQGEVAELKDNINQMIANLRETTETTRSRTGSRPTWPGSPGTMQGQRDLRRVTQLIMSELTPLVGAQQGAFFLVETTAEGGRRCG